MSHNPILSNTKIAIIGLGYVGLPLAVEFAKKYPVTGFDINLARINELNQFRDSTLEVESCVLEKILCKCNILKDGDQSGLYLTSEVGEIKEATVYIVTVPTPIDKNNCPELTPLIRASEIIGRVLKQNDTVIYESTVYPGVTEEVCVPALERASGLVFNRDFFAGYSPERINPGDKTHTVTQIKKVTSGSTPETAKAVDALYRSIITAGTHSASSIKIAEAAKVIENAQRDINIAFVNELAKIFNLLEIDTLEVLEAAGTKWNFQPFRPGLVGGHCIGVDPYYLAQKAQQVGYHPEIILAGRRLNDGMGAYVAGRVVKNMIAKGIPVKGARTLVLGIAFKENCPDIRNTRVIDIVRELQDYGIMVDVHDPWADPDEVFQKFGLKTLPNLNPNGQYDALILAVAHGQFTKMELTGLLNDNCVVYDVKGVLDPKIVDERL
jgi:UDP-N-acetyl-D-glucosamine/UDP-N-acetyl-D-galactosamine dehydrogenase